MENSQKRKCLEKKKDSTMLMCLVPKASDAREHCVMTQTDLQDLVVEWP